MDINALQSLLGWCSLINYVLLIVWFLIFRCCHQWIFQLHGRWFNLSESNFDHIHYCGMGLWKMFWFFFNLLPYLVLRFS